MNHAKNPMVVLDIDGHKNLFAVKTYNTWPQCFQIIHITFKVLMLYIIRVTSLLEINVNYFILYNKDSIEE